MEPVNRREFIAAAALAPLLQTARPAGSMFVCMHEASSDRFDFKTAMEGWARAGIRAVEPNLTKVREFTQTALAQQVNVHPSAIAQLETGRIQPSPAVLDAIGRATGFPPAFSPPSTRWRSRAREPSSFS